MDKNIPLWRTMVVIFVVFMFLILSEIFIPLSFVFFPFVLYLLVNLKLASNYHYWLTFISFLFPVFLLTHPIAWVTFVVLYISGIVIVHTLKNNDSQEITYFYLASSMVLSAMLMVIILQVTEVISPLGERFGQFQTWYFDQLEGTTATQLISLDPETIRQSFELFFQNIPAYFTILMALLAIYTVVMIRLLMQSSSQKLWNYEPFQNWQIPRLTLAIFFIMFILSLIIPNEGPFYIMLQNGLVITQWLFYVHGLSFLLYVLMRKLRTPLAILLIVPIALFQPIVMMIGVVDLVFKLRQKIQQRRK